ncbi:MAG: PKD domain-containing protein [Acidobacteria bacterium]|nr:PKD domain-containing protein [Acidobacteriota bacterium]
MSARAQIQEEERCEGFICDMSEVEQTWCTSSDGYRPRVQSRIDAIDYILQHDDRVQYIGPQLQDNLEFLVGVRDYCFPYPRYCPLRPSSVDPSASSAFTTYVVHQSIGYPYAFFNKTGLDAFLSDVHENDLFYMPEEDVRCGPLANRFAAMKFNTERRDGYVLRSLGGLNFSGTYISFVGGHFDASIPSQIRKFISIDSSGNSYFDWSAHNVLNMRMPMAAIYTHLGGLTLQQVYDSFPEDVFLQYVTESTIESNGFLPPLEAALNDNAISFELIGPESDAQPIYSRPIQGSNRLLRVILVPEHQSADRPDVDFEFVQSAQLSGVLVAFHGAAMSPVGLDIVGWEWDFGAGNTACTQDASFVFSTAGSFPVSLRVIDSHGQIASITHNVVIESYEPPYVTLIPPFGKWGSGFGAHLASNGQELVVSNTYESGGYTEHGVHLYDHFNNSFVNMVNFSLPQAAQIEALTMGSNFVAAGAPASGFQGLIYHWPRVQGLWQPHRTISYIDFFNTTSIGRIISGSGPLLAVTAEYEDPTQNRVMIYQVGAQNTVRTSTIYGPGDATYFGERLALNGTRMAVHLGLTRRKLNLYKTSDYVNWQLTQSINAPSNSNSFGTSLAMGDEGNYLLVGDPEASYGGVNCGVAYLYQLSGNAYSLISTYAPTVTEMGQRFGQSVAVSRSGADVTLFIGAPDDGDNQVGAVYEITRRGSQVIREVHHAVWDAQDFGSTVSFIQVNGEAEAAIGAPDTLESGRVFIAE